MNKTQIRKLSQYPDSLSKEQFRKLCHISKRTALRLLTNGLVPCAKLKSGVYRISRADVSCYLKERELDPERFSYIAAERPDNEVWTKRERQIQLRKCAEALLQDEATVLKVPDIKRLLGYNDRTVYSWLRSGELENRLIKCNHPTYFIQKKALLEFIIGSTFQSIVRKSRQHLTLLEDAAALAHEERQK